jgi:hypothetical protein
MALVAALALISAAAVAACGSSKTTDRAAPADPAAFAWLHPAAPPAGWTVTRLPSGQASLAYPPSWRLTRTDPGTVTASLERNGQIAGYLNLTPKSGDETLANWATFRPAHNREEGDSDLVPIASASGLRFRNGIGSCVTDRYTTSTSRQYEEIACIVRGPRTTTVVVGAAPTSLWSQISPTLERAISSFDAEG